MILTNNSYSSVNPESVLANLFHVEHVLHNSVLLCVLLTRLAFMTNLCNLVEFCCFSHFASSLSLSAVSLSTSSRSYSP